MKERKPRFNAQTDAKRTATAKRQTIDRKRARRAKYSTREGR